MKSKYSPIIIIAMIISCSKVDMPFETFLLQGENLQDTIIVAGIPDTFELIQNKIQLTTWTELPQNGYAGFVHSASGKKIAISAKFIPAHWTYRDAVDTSYSGDLKRDEYQKLNDSSFYSRYFTITKNNTIYDLRKMHIFKANIMFEISMISHFTNLRSPYRYNIIQDDFIKKIVIKSKTNIK